MEDKRFSRRKIERQVRNVCYCSSRMASSSPFSSDSIDRKRYVESNYSIFVDVYILFFSACLVVEMHIHMKKNGQASESVGLLEGKETTTTIASERENIVLASSSWWQMTFSHFFPPQPARNCFYLLLLFFLELTLVTSTTCVCLCI